MLTKASIEKETITRKDSNENIVLNNKLIYYLCRDAGWLTSGKGWSRRLSMGGAAGLNIDVFS